MELQDLERQEAVQVVVNNKDDGAENPVVASSSAESA
jgi:hypothetical protein